MKTITKILALAVVATAFTASVQAVPINGVIGFTGSVQLNGPTVETSKEVLSWGSDNKVNTASGDFSGLTGLSVTLFSPWYFKSGPLNNFWSVGGFHFNLTQSSVFTDAGGFLAVVLAGTVVNSNFDPTAFVGRITVQDFPTVNGTTYVYTESLSFNSVPDGGTTVLLLGSALSGLALLRRKLAA